MQSGVLGHTVPRWLCGVGDELIGRFGWERGRRLERRRRRLRLLFFEFDQPPADEEAVEDNADSDQKWEYSDQPQTAKHLREMVVVSPRHYVEEGMEKDHHANADEAGDDAALDLFESFLFRRDADPQLFHGMRMGNLGPPGFVPIGLSF